MSDDSLRILDREGVPRFNCVQVNPLSYIKKKWLGESTNPYKTNNGVFFFCIHLHLSSGSLRDEDLERTSFIVKIFIWRELFEPWRKVHMREGEVKIKLSRKEMNGRVKVD